MKPERLRDLLVQTLDDSRMSRSEQSALRQILEHMSPSEQTLSVYRKVAFEVARDALKDHAATDVVEWLEDVARVLQSNLADTKTESEAWFSPEDECHPRIVRLFESARLSADVCVFTITDDRITKAIIAAHERGLPVRIISDDEKAFDVGSDIERLGAAGVPVRVDKTRYHMHHKFAVFDRDLLLTGSYNWTRSAEEFNEENFIVTSDPKLVRKFGGMFDRLWKQFG